MNEIPKIKACGEVRLDLDLIYYPLGNYYYAINSHGDKRIIPAKAVMEEGDGEGKRKQKQKIKYWTLQVNEEETYIFEDTPLGKNLPYNNPIDLDLASKWFEDDKNYSIDEVYMSIKKVLRDCYDFSDEKDLDIAILFILQSWFVDVLNGVFYVDVRSQMGGGKTILLELMQGMSRYGVLANDMSFAVIPRIIDRYKCTLFFDEIDMINKHVIEDVFKILRTGYRKGQRYIRAKPKTLEPEVFDCYGAKAFNYRSDIADDLKNRSLPINTCKSSDKMLPILNLYKEKLLKPVVYKIFCFYMNSLTRLQEVNKLFIEQMMGVDGDLVNEVKEVNELMVNTDTENIYISPSRIHFFHLITHFWLNSLTLLTDKHTNLSNLSEKELTPYFLELFKKLTGRSVEIFSLVIHLCSYIGLDIYQNFQSILEEKAEFENHDEEDLKNILREILINREPMAHIHEVNSLKYVYYRDIQSEFLREVHSIYGYKPSTSQLKKYLRELGFVDKKNKKVLKFGSTLTSLCLIYDDSIKKVLGV